MIRIDLNLGSITTRLAEVGATLSDMTPIFEDIAEELVLSTKRRFATGTAPDGTRWRPKSPVTREKYRKAGHGDRPDPLIGPSRALGETITRQVTTRSAEIGSALIYSGTMQLGAAKGAFGKNRAGRPIPWGTIPPRPFLGISADDERNILDIVDEHLGAAIGE